MSISDDTIIARAVVESRLATQDEVEACRRRLAELRDVGQQISLADVLIHAGYITRSQFKRLAKAGIEDSMTRSARHIPGYHIEKKLGQGAMATVWKAKQLSLDRTVAIKILPKRLSENPEFVERFYKEGKAAARLNSANIVQAVDVGEYQGYHYFVMEYVDGHTVYDEVATKGKIYGEQEALDIIIQVARALNHAHQKGLIHRDVKPKNIMITKEGVVKLADMGLARAMDDKEAAAAEAGRAYGTPYYISPEQIRGELDIDFRADIYSLGATFYHMVTGRVPFDGPTPSAVMHKHLKEPLLPPDHINTSLSAGTAEVIEVMMAKNRDQRYASTEDLLKDLLAVQRGDPPLQARQRIDPKLLAKLAKAETESPTEEPAGAPDAETVQHAPSQQAVTASSSVIILLLVMLSLSVLVNIVTLVWLAVK